MLMMHKIKGRMLLAVKVIFKDALLIILSRIKCNSKIFKRFHVIFKTALISKINFNKLAKDKVKLLKKHKMNLRTLIMLSSWI